MVPRWQENKRHISVNVGTILIFYGQYNVFSERILGIYTSDNLLDFLAHAAERGLMPAATAQALAVATRNVFTVLDDAERASLPLDDIDAIVRRFHNKRARDLNPSSLKEYERRTKRAVELFLRWKRDPANFTVPTRVTSVSSHRGKHGVRTGDTEGQTAAGATAGATVPAELPVGRAPAGAAAVYETQFPVRAGHMVHIANLPFDLTVAEAERLAQFLQLLGAE